MDRSDRQHLRMLRCQRDQRVVLRPSVLDVSLQRLAGTAEPHAAKCGDLPLRGRDLGLILVDRLRTIAQMNVQIERGILRGRRMGQEQQSCQGGNLLLLHHHAGRPRMRGAVSAHGLGVARGPRLLSLRLKVSQSPHDCQPRRHKGVHPQGDTRGAGRAHPVPSSKAGRDPSPGGPRRGLDARLAEYPGDTQRA
jgi:hypothetical protein